MIFATGGLGGIPKIGIHNRQPDRRSFVPCYNDSLELQYQIPTPTRHYRLCQVFDPEDSSARLFALTQYEKPFAVALCDVETRQLVSFFSGHTTEVLGIASLSANRIVSGSNGAARVLVHDVKTGQTVHQLRHPPDCTKRIMGIPSWSQSDVIVAGSRGTLLRYDMTRGDQIEGGRFQYDGHSDSPAHSVYGLTEDPSRHLLISSSNDNTVRGWSKTSRDCGVTIQLNAESHSLYMIPEKSLLLIGSRNGSTDEGGVDVRDLRSPDRRVNWVRLASGSLTTGGMHDIDQIDEQRFVSCFMNGLTAVWNPFRHNEEGGKGGEMSLAKITRESGSFTYGVRVLRDPTTFGLEGSALVDERERLTYLLERECFVEVEYGHVVIHSLFRSFILS